MHMFLTYIPHIPHIYLIYTSTSYIPHISPIYTTYICMYMSRLPHIYISYISHIYVIYIHHLYVMYNSYTYTCTHICHPPSLLYRQCSSERQGIPVTALWTATPASPETPRPPSRWLSGTSLPFPLPIFAPFSSKNPALQATIQLTHVTHLHFHFVILFLIIPFVFPHNRLVFPLRYFHTRRSSKPPPFPSSNIRGLLPKNPARRNPVFSGGLLPSSIQLTHVTHLYFQFGILKTPSFPLSDIPIPLGPQKPPENRSGNPPENRPDPETPLTPRLYPRALFSETRLKTARKAARAHTFHTHIHTSTLRWLANGAKAAQDAGAIKKTYCTSCQRKGKPAQKSCRHCPGIPQKPRKRCFFVKSARKWPENRPKTARNPPACPGTLSRRIFGKPPENRPKTARVRVNPVRAVF
jgi:hypothetical protein